MARDLRHLPGRELGVDLLGQRLALLLQARDLLGDVDRRIVLHEAQLFDARFELRDRLLEIEEGGFACGGWGRNFTPEGRAQLTPPTTARAVLTVVDSALRYQRLAR